MLLEHFNDSKRDKRLLLCPGLLNSSDDFKCSNPSPLRVWTLPDSPKVGDLGNDDIWYNVEWRRFMSKKRITHVIQGIFTDITLYKSVRGNYLGHKNEKTVILYAICKITYVETCDRENKTDFSEKFHLKRKEVPVHLKYKIFHNGLKGFFITNIT